MTRVRRFKQILFFLLLIAHCSLLTFFSCTRKDEKTANDNLEKKAMPMAIIQTGKLPVWVQLTEYGPAFIESIEDAVETSAFIPWPLTLHVRFIHEAKDFLDIVVNRDGFLRILPEDQGLVLYRFPGGEFWKQYTVGGFVYYNDQPVALLCLEDRFLKTTVPLPNPRTWTFNMESNSLFPVSIPALELFPADEGWNADSLRQGTDGLMYYRVSKKESSQGEIQMIRTANLAQAGISISVEDFFNSAPRQTAINTALLPDLPKGFVYTNIANIGDSVFASWEEQDAFNIGAAGFMFIKSPIK